MLIDIFHVLPFFFLAVALSIFGTYGLVLLYYGRSKKRDNTLTNLVARNESGPLVSIVVPTHNEEKVISSKVENLLSVDYPSDRLELIFVDDSSDSTAEILQNYAKKHTNIRVLRFHERMGYSPSMIAGCKSAKGEIVILNDAASFIDVHAVSRLVCHFSNPNVGVVTGNDLILNVDEAAGKSESFYQRILNFVRVAETKMDSTFYIKGEATAVRRNLIEDLQYCSETFDTTIGLFVRQKGFRVIFDPEVKFYEYAPSYHSERVKQKTIRAANLVKVLWHHRSLMFKREYGKYGWLILPMNFGMLVVAPLAILCSLLFMIPLVLIDPNLSLIVLGIVGLTLVSSLVISRSFVFNVLEFEYSLLKALYQVLFTRKAHDKIDKVDSTRRLG